MDKLKLHSKNITDDNIENIAQLFPNCVTEVEAVHNGEKVIKKAIDFDLLRQELSATIVEGQQERYQLNWPGKREALLAANAPIAKTLRPNRDESVDFDTTENLFIEGDNLEALKLLQETYLGKVKMIYIDPPYNTGNDFIYDDDFAEDAEEYFIQSEQKDDVGNRLVANTESNGRFHSDWLSMIYMRLKLARNLLSDSGVIFISIDDNEIHNLKKICDEVFGEENFRNIFILKRYDKNINRQFIDDGLATFNTGFEYVICYSKTSTFKFKAIYRDASEERQNSGYWKGFWNDANRPTMRYNILGFTPQEGQWKWSKEKAEEAVENYKKYEEEFSAMMTLEQYWETTGKTKKFIRRNISGKGKNMGVEHWIEPSAGILRNTNWLDIFASKTTSEVKGLFDFPKNPDAIKLMIESVGAKNEIILDFFAGSGTTAQAIMEYNLEVNGKTKYICVQLPELISDKPSISAQGFKYISDISKERIRRVGKKIQNENPLKAKSIDVGFRVLKVESSNMHDVYYSPDAVSQKALFDTIDNIKGDRTEEDLLFQVLLDWGVDLTLPIVKEKVCGLDVFFVDDNALAACFSGDGKITDELCRELAGRHPLRTVFRDSGFKDDSVKINAEQIFKQISPNTDIKVI